MTMLMRGALWGVLLALGEAGRFRAEPDADPISVTVVFKEKHQLVDIGAEIPVSTEVPTITAAFADAGAPPPIAALPIAATEVDRLIGAWITVADGRTFEVLDPRPTGNGGVLCVVNEAQRD
ncbi:head-tail joining protein [Desulfarculus baarsii]